MSRPPKILAFAGSTRKGSYNKMLARLAAEEAKRQGAEVTLIDLRDFPLPLYDGDWEQEHGIPENGIKLKELMIAHQGLLLSCPEYNSSITGVLKNAIDWTSRPRENEPPLACFKGKVAALFSASPGALGGLRGLVHVRAILGNLGTLVLPSQMALSKAEEAFTPEGELNDPKQENRVRGLIQEFVEILGKLQPS